jgi:Predicted Fe-S oxidoreductases
LTLAEYQKLAAAFHSLGVHVVSIAGGEPLMRDDIFSIIDAFAKYRMKVNLCTNGILLESCVEKLCRSGAFCITVSIDGATAQTHDKLRGMDGSFDQIKKGIERFMIPALPHQPLLRVRMTISNHNTHEIRSFYEQWKNRADDILLQPIHYCQDAFYTGFEEESLRLAPDLLEQQIEGTPLQTNGYLKKLIHSLRQTNTYPNERCYAGVLMVRIDPWGNVYPCLEQHVSIGSVRDHDFSDLWNSGAFDRERAKIVSEGTCRCWYNNTAMISHYGKILFHTTVPGLRKLCQNHFNVKKIGDTW